VFINVDFPNPVWPVMIRGEHVYVSTSSHGEQVDKSHRAELSCYTNADNIELKATFEKLSFNLLCNAIETDVTSGVYC